LRKAKDIGVDQNYNLAYWWPQILMDDFKRFAGEHPQDKDAKVDPEISGSV
jgi:hypothetical protein